MLERSNTGIVSYARARVNTFFESYVHVPRIRVGYKQSLETLINEEALLLAKFIRKERKQWKPRIIAN